MGTGGMGTGGMGTGGMAGDGCADLSDCSQCADGMSDGVNACAGSASCLPVLQCLQGCPP